MPTQCCAANCSNVASETVSLFRFPRDPKLRKEWTLQVQRTRDNWKGPTDSSRLCSEHFLPACIDFVPDLKASLGFSVQHKRGLVENAIPTIFKRKITDPSPGSPTKRRSAASAKLEQRRIVTEALRESCIFDDNTVQPEWSIDDSVEKQALAPQSTTDASCQTISLQHTDKRNVSVSVRPKGKNKGTQTVPSNLCRSVTTTINIPPKLLEIEGHVLRKESQEITEESEEEDQGEVNSHRKLSDPDYNPSPGEESDASIPDEDEPQLGFPKTEEPIHKSKKYIIFLNAILQLLSWCCCPQCGHKDLLSAAILFAGATVKKVLRVFRHMGVVAISSRTFFRHQKTILQKAVLRVWRNQQSWFLARLLGLGLICGGDGRADSPGRTAKNGTYTLLELQYNAILDIQLVQSTECGGSYHMEKEGLVRSLQVLKDHDLDVDILITDRHRQIAKFLREEHPEIQHLYDIWHVAKSVKTKLRAAAKKAGCQDIGAWVSSIINHLYWSATSTPAGDGELIEAKWVSVVDHIQNKHTQLGGRFPQCSHGNLEGREAKKKWISPGSKAAIEIEKIITNKMLCKDIRKLSGNHQTSTIEAFHSLLIHFAPKMLSFSFEGMLIRVILAALHYNENAHREQSTTADGKPQYKINYPKFKQGGYVVRKILKAHSFRYVDDLMECISNIMSFDNAEDDPGDSPGDPVPLEVPPYLNANYYKPTKEEAVLAHVTRFSRN